MLITQKCGTTQPTRKAKRRERRRRKDINKKSEEGTRIRYSSPCCRTRTKRNANTQRIKAHAHGIPLRCVIASMRLCAALRQFLRGLIWLVAQIKEIIIIQIDLQVLFFVHKWYVALLFEFAFGQLFQFAMFGKLVGALCTKSLYTILQLAIIYLFNLEQTNKLFN